MTISSYGSIPKEDRYAEYEREEIFQFEVSKASWWSLLTFRWFDTLMKHGNSVEQLKPEDLNMLPLPPSCTTKNIMDNFELYWNESQSLVRSLVKAFGLEFVKAGGLKLIHDLCIFVGPNALHGLIQFFLDADAPLSRGFFLTAAIFFSQIMMSCCQRHYFFQCYLTGLRVRTCVVTAVYRKALILSSDERQIRTVGEIVNLVGVDAQRLQDLIAFLHAIWYTFLQIVLGVFFLWQQLGPSCLGGVAVIIVTIPVTRALSQWMGRTQSKLMEARDKRTDVNNEALGSIKIIKIQGWEKKFQKKIEDLREMELKKLLISFIVFSLSIMVWNAVPVLVAVATFTTYVFSGNKLDVASALTAIVLIDILRVPLSQIPRSINNLVEASVSFSRVQSFLLCKEYEPISSGHIQDCGISIQHSSFVYNHKKPNLPDDKKDRMSVREMNDIEWEIRLLRSQLVDAENNVRALCGYTMDENNDDFEPHLLSLRRINFECKRGEFIAVVGAVGSGKSTFLNSILGEMRALSGTLYVKGKLAYLSQTPFILNESLKNNILFGHVKETFDRVKYDKAIKVCALAHDLKLLSDGDRTEIGEKGITLSGGQKARVAMARAMYHDADIYLLDDPLAAVDAHVGRHLFGNCIINEMFLDESKARNKTVILVTNAIQYLSNPMVDKIIVLNDGCIHEAGTYDELSQNPRSLFASFLAAMAETAGTNNGSQEDQSVSEESLSSNEKLEGQRLFRRSSSLHSEKKEVDGTTNTPPLLTSEFEERKKGHVDLSVYITWVQSAGGVWIGVCIILAYGLVESINVLSMWWLTYWSQAKNAQNTDSQMYFLLIYAIINMTRVIGLLVRYLLVSFSSLRVSMKIFHKLLDIVLRAPMSFFDTTPSGRIINRFSKDMYTLDEKLLGTINAYLSYMSNVIVRVVVISTITPQFIYVLIPLLMFYVSKQASFTKTYGELKRLDSVARSPIYAILAETLDGVATIRSFAAQTTFKEKMESILDEQQTAYYLICTARCWLGVRLELTGTIIILCACLFAVLGHSTKGGDEVFAGLAGLSISFALSVTNSLNWAVLMSSDLDANMIALERVLQYCRIPTEAAHSLETDNQIAPMWPKEGTITFSRAKLKYRPNLPLVLKDLNITIPAMSKIGVVGRTGSGKSTLMVSLLRIVELYEGSILIDGIDISKLGLNLLRSNIAVIPQEPMLFSGTVRSNLDPFDQYSSERLKEVLRLVGLMKESIPDDNEISIFSVPSDSILSSLSERKVTETVESLSDPVLENGTNFSVGQQQLLVIARALLCGAKIVLIDEATASVDADTDARIQRIIRTEFQNSTRIIIAHRINTIIDSDYILVMNDGRAVEFDSPRQLLRNGGFFKDLVDTWEQEHKPELSVVI